MMLKITILCGRIMVSLAAFYKKIDSENRKIIIFKLNVESS